MNIVYGWAYWHGHYPGVGIGLGFCKRFLVNEGFWRTYWSLTLTFIFWYVEIMHISKRRRSR